MSVEVPLRLSQLKTEYQQLWEKCQIKPEQVNSAKNIVAKILANRARYEAVQKKINVPWYFIAVIHNMESSLSFSRHLHNGDSLKKRTVQVPADRPVADPVNGWQVGYTWEESAIDALTMKEFDKVKDWSLAAQLWQIERYNGFGYRQYHPDVLTPYLWSGTNHYTKGKYTADGKWNADAVSEQIGAAALLKILIQEQKLTVKLV
jgi:lysozyme family protein